MNKSYPFSEINSALSGAKNIGILIGDDPDYDITAASLALFLSLEKAGKRVSVASPTPMRVEFSHLVGLDKITNRISERENLTISIDYPVNNVEKVSFDDSNEKVNLIIKLKDNAPLITNDKIKFSEAGQALELYFFVGGRNPASFDKLISLEKIQTQNSIAITKQQSAALGKIQVVDPTASSYSEIVTAILVSLSLPSDQDIAQNLFLGLSKATVDFSNHIVSADTFEAAALCLRAGAKRELVEETPSLVKLSSPSPDWLQPKIYRGASLI